MFDEEKFIVNYNSSPNDSVLTAKMGLRPRGSDIRSVRYFRENLGLPEKTGKLLKKHRNDEDLFKIYLDGEVIPWNAIRNRHLKLYPTGCAICSSFLNLEVHHIDKNRKNNLFTNLLGLCNNCHINFIHKLKKGSFTMSGNITSAEDFCSLLQEREQVKVDYPNLKDKRRRPAYEDIAKKWGFENQNSMDSAVYRFKKQYREVWNAFEKNNPNSVSVKNSRKKKNDSKSQKVAVITIPVNILSQIADSLPSGVRIDIKDMI